MRRRCNISSWGGREEKESHGKVQGEEHCGTESLGSLGFMVEYAC